MCFANICLLLRLYNKPYNFNKIMYSSSFSTYNCRNLKIYDVQLNNKGINKTVFGSNLYFPAIFSHSNRNYKHIRQYSTEYAQGAYAQSGWFQSLSESTPVNYAKDFLIFVHDTSGLPWWGSIILTTIILRTFITVPFALYQNYIFAKVENLQLEMPEIAKELKVETAYAIQKFNWTEKEARVMYKRSLKKQWNKLIIRDNCHPFKASILLYVQLPTWIIFSAAMRNMVYMLPSNDIAAQLICLELSVGGFLWVPNLTIPDSSWILPVFLGLTNLAIIELQTLSKVKKSTKLQRYLTNFFRVFSVVMIPIAASVPSCLGVYWATSSMYGLGQNLVLLSPHVKRWWGIPQTPSHLEKPYQHIALEIKKRAEKLLWWKNQQI